MATTKKAVDLTKPTRSRIRPSRAKAPHGRYTNGEPIPSALHAEKLRESRVNDARTTGYAHRVPEPPPSTDQFNSLSKQIAEIREFAANAVQQARQHYVQPDAPRIFGVQPPEPNEDTCEAPRTASGIGHLIAAHQAAQAKVPTEHPGLSELKIQMSGVVGMLENRMDDLGRRVYGPVPSPGKIDQTTVPPGAPAREFLTDVVRRLRALEDRFEYLNQQL